MHTEFRRKIPALQSLHSTLAAEAGTGDDFSVDVFLIHAWLHGLLTDAAAQYAERKSQKRLPLQTGQAQYGFLKIFGNPTDAAMHRLLQSLYRFTECDDPLSHILFRSLVLLSTEHESVGDFLGTRAPDAAERPRQTVLWMRESFDRWCDWLDAVIHLHTHAQWHLSPECFDPDPQNRQNAVRAVYERNGASLRATEWRARSSDTTSFANEQRTWDVAPRPENAQPQRPWPHPELDEVIISVWPILKRHNWTFTDLLTVLRDLVSDSQIYPLQSERNMAMYCTGFLQLRKNAFGKTSRGERPPGYLVALKLFPPPEPPPMVKFGPAESGA